MWSWKRIFLPIAQVVTGVGLIVNGNVAEGAVAIWGGVMLAAGISVRPVKVK